MSRSRASHYSPIRRDFECQECIYSIQAHHVCSIMFYELSLRRGTRQIGWIHATLLPPCQSPANSAFSTVHAPPNRRDESQYSDLGMVDKLTKVSAHFSPCLWSSDRSRVLYNLFPMPPAWRRNNQTAESNLPSSIALCLVTALTVWGWPWSIPPPRIHFIKS